MADTPHDGMDTTFSVLAVEIAHIGLAHIERMKEMEREHFGERSFLVTSDQYIAEETFARVAFQTAYGLAERAGTVHGEAAYDAVIDSVDEALDGRIPEDFRH